MQHATVWMDRIQTVEREPAEADHQVGAEHTWVEDGVLHHRRVGRFPDVDRGRVAIDAFPLFFGFMALVGGVAMGAAHWPFSAEDAAHSIEEPRFIGQITFSALGNQDQNPLAGRGVGEVGDGADAGADFDGEQAEGSWRREERLEVEGESGLAGGSGPFMLQGSGRVEALEAGLTSRDSDNLLASASSGLLEEGAEGQLHRGTANGADGSIDRLGGLADWGGGKGLRGPDQGPGADRWGVTDGADGAAFLEARPRGFVARTADPTSTFALEVDRASYARARGELRAGARPQASLIRPEEFVNAMPMHLDAGEHDLDLAAHPDGGDRALLRVSLRLPEVAERPPLDVVLVLDDSCSMDNPDKLELARKSVSAFMEGLEEQDRVRLVSFHHREPVEGAELSQTLATLTAGGGSPLGQGVTDAFQLVADENGRRRAVVVLADGGSSGTSTLASAWKARPEDDIGFAVVGFGRSGHEGEMLEELALVTGGPVRFVDSGVEALALSELPGELAASVESPRLHVAFGEGVERWRLVGYSNRLLTDQSSGDGHAVRGGTVGWGATVTALYELELGSGDQVASAWLRADGLDRPLGTVHAGDLGSPTAGTTVAWAAAGLAEYLAGEDIDLEARRIGEAGFDPEHAALDGLISLALRLPEP